MNIICKGFDGRYCKEILEGALGGISLETVITITNHLNELPELPMRKHIWVPAKEQRAGIYKGLDWQKINPLDEELIESMRACESVFLVMAERYALGRELSYAERKRQYFDHLRYWNHMLDTNNIDLLFMNNLPHQCFDYVLYCLCKHKDIPIRFVERCYVVDGCYLIEDLEESAIELQEKITSLQQTYAASQSEVPLSQKYEEYFRRYSQEQVLPWIMYWRHDHLKSKTFLGKWIGQAVRVLLHRPGKFFRSIFSAEFWTRKMEQHRTFRFYDRHTTKPNLEERYIFFPLHLQPEASTCPQSGAYADQERIVQLIANYLPIDVKIYVKEHQTQGEPCRSEQFYRALVEIPQVTFLPRDEPSVPLIKNALAVATGTGTAGFEALMQEKPVLMFGHRFYQYAPGIHQIRTNEDCKKAIESCLNGEHPSKKDARIFLKAVEETSILCEGGLTNEYEPLSDRERAVVMGKEIGKLLQQLS